MTNEALIADLKTTFLFEDCTEEQIQWAADHGEMVAIEAGILFLDEDVMPEFFYVLLEGEIELSRRVEGRKVVLDKANRPGIWSGWLPHYEISPVFITVRTKRDSRFLRLSQESMRYIMANGFPLVNHLLSGLTSGARVFEGTVVQQQKLAALGRFSAGLAHELNNPAAAARRAASDLHTALRTRDERTLRLLRYVNEDQIRDGLLLVQKIELRELVVLDPITAGDREDELIDWLQNNGIKDSYQIGPSLVDSSVTIDDLEALKQGIPPAALPDAVAWLESVTTADELARLIELSLERISALVAAIKEYTFMDREGQQEVDLHQGLDSTLLILKHELKNGVDVIRDYDPTLPNVCAYGSELNQVWTNLIDNAAQAMEGKGQLRIVTHREGDRVLVEIIDNGPGIPESIRDQIFEPFFTTKDVGVGTGMGLDIVRRVIWRHGGDVRVQSQPGETRFQVRLPIEKVQIQN